MSNDECPMASDGALKAGRGGRRVSTRSRSWLRAKAGLDFGFGDCAELAGGEIAESEVAELDAVEGKNGCSGGGEHTADLVVFALGEDEVGGAGGGGGETEVGRGAGGVFAVEDQCAGGEERDEIGREVAVHGGAVELGDLVFRRGIFVDELGLVGEEDQAGGVLVEATDGGDLGVAGAPAFGEEVVNARAFAFVVGADEAEGFVEKKEQALGVVERFAVDEDVGGTGFGGRIANGGAADGDGVFLEVVTGLAAGAVAEVGEELVEAAHGGKGEGMRGIGVLNHEKRERHERVKNRNFCHKKHKRHKRRSGSDETREQGEGCSKYFAPVGSLRT
jgi:hypothetical protein